MQFDHIPKDATDIDIQMTVKGISAAMGRYFLEKHSEIFWRRFIDISLVACNTCVAIVAIIALLVSKNDDRLKVIESRLDKAEQAMKQMPLRPNPPQTIKKDSANKHVTP